MQLKIFCKYTLLTGAVIIEGIKWGIRPYFNFNQPTTFLLGIAPNLLGSFLLPFGCYWLLSKYINLHSDKQLKWFCVVCFCLLIINEVLQLIPVFGRTFDYSDITASLLGLTASYFLCSKYLFVKLAKYP
ncbi:hypothetical protein [Ferruginibacter sp.]|jgi:drug/metabolite transporter (DMT)-like permease